MTEPWSPQFQLIVDHRTVIGQAQGILMERFNITADDAFNALRGASQSTHVKLYLVAVQLVDTGEWSPFQVPEQPTQPASYAARRPRPRPVAPPG